MMNTNVFFVKLWDNVVQLSAETSKRVKSIFFVQHFLSVELKSSYFGKPMFKRNL